MTPQITRNSLYLNVFEFKQSKFRWDAMNWRHFGRTYGLLRSQGVSWMLPATTVSCLTLSGSSMYTTVCCQWVLLKAPMTRWDGHKAKVRGITLNSPFQWAQAKYIWRQWDYTGWDARKKTDKTQMSPMATQRHCQSYEKISYLLRDTKWNEAANHCPPILLEISIYLI